jgi:hypothetical protein
MKFDTVEDAYTFFCDYAQMAGFDVRRDRKTPQVSWYVCNKQGFCDGDKVDKRTEKGLMRIGCKCHVKVKQDVKGNYWLFDILALEHNHLLSLHLYGPFYAGIRLWKMVSKF